MSEEGAPVGVTAARFVAPCAHPGDVLRADAALRRLATPLGFAWRPPGWPRWMAGNEGVRYRQLQDS